MQSEEIKEGLILRLTPIKEADAMVQAIGKDGFFSFYARGVRKMTSKNAPSVQECCYGRYSLMVSSQGKLTLKEGAPLSLLYKGDSLSAMAVGMLLNELTLKVVSEEDASDVYPWLYASLKAIQEGKEPLTIGIIYFAKVMKETGYGLNVEECVRCARKEGIVGISYEEGGFICKKCLREDDVAVSRPSQKTLKILLYLFRVGLEDLSRVSFEPSEVLPLYSRFGEHLQYTLGISLHSLSMISRL